MTHQQHMAEALHQAGRVGILFALLNERVRPDVTPRTRAEDERLLAEAEGAAAGHAFRALEIMYDREQSALVRKI